MNSYKLVGTHGSCLVLPLAQGRGNLFQVVQDLEQPEIELHVFFF